MLMFSNTKSFLNFAPLPSNNFLYVVHLNQISNKVSFNHVHCSHSFFLFFCHWLLRKPYHLTEGPNSRFVWLPPYGAVILSTLFPANYKLEIKAWWYSVPIFLASILQNLYCVLCIVACQGEHHAWLYHI